MKIKRSITILNRDHITVTAKELWKSKINSRIKVAFIKLEDVPKGSLVENLVFYAHIYGKYLFKINMETEEEIVLGVSFFKSEILYDKENDVYIFEFAPTMKNGMKRILVDMLFRVKSVGKL